MNKKNNMKILVTGSNGFIAKNLIVKLKEHKYEVLEFNRKDNFLNLHEKISNCDLIFHLAGENRSEKEESFIKSNINLTKEICRICSFNKLKIPLIFSSSIHSNKSTPYGKSKKIAENSLRDLNLSNKNPIKIYRLPGVFGKWCKPFYNSVVATFSHSLANNLEMNIINPDNIIQLIYIDDLVNNFIFSINNFKEGLNYGIVEPIYKISVKHLAEILNSFKESRDKLFTEKVGNGLMKKLYATFTSYLPIDDSVYSIPSYSDKRGKFVEMLKTKESGQISFFTAKPGVTRGGHYHHSKIEKFLVIKGKAKFRFMHILTKEFKEIYLTDNNTQIVESIPGWSHDIKNIGNEEMIVMLWANEIFDKNNPDTFIFEL